MPTAPTITVTDLANGGGVSVDVVGDAGATHQVYRQRWGSSEWTAFGAPQVGSGTVTGTITPGYYWWYVLASESGSDAISALTQQVVTRDSDAIDMRLLDGVFATIQAAYDANALPAVKAVKKFEDPFKSPRMTTPGIAVYGQQTGSEIGGGNNRDDFQHVVLIALMYPNGKDRDLALAAERVRKLFHRQRLAGVSTEAFDCVVSPGPPLAEENTILDFAWVHWQLTYTYRERRGI